MRILTRKKEQEFCSKLQKILDKRDKETEEYVSKRLREYDKKLNRYKKELKKKEESIEETIVAKFNDWSFKLNDQYAMHYLSEMEEMIKNLKKRKNNH